MKNRHKTQNCLNCSLELPVHYNYCPRCGQENDDKHQSIWRLVVDFFSNYFSLDGRFGRSIKPFFTKPGFLTIAYNKGQRASYANPVRLYLVLSLFFFFVLSFYGDRIIDKNDGNMNFLGEDAAVQVKNAANDTDKQIQALIDQGKLQDTAQVNKAMEFLGVDKEKRDSVIQVLLEERAKALAATDSLEDQQFGPFSLKFGDDRDTVAQAPADSATLAAVAGDSTQKDSTQVEDDYYSDEFFLSDKQWKVINALSNNRDYTVTQVLDSAKVSQENTLGYMIALQVLKVNRNPEYFIGYIFKNLPLMMLLLLPLFALLLKFLYLRRSFFYIDHLIHSLHLHTMAYFVYGLVLIVSINAPEAYETWVDILSGVTFLGMNLYVYKSFRRVYGQGRFKTFIKYWFCGVVYSTMIFIFLLGEFFVSFALF